VVLSVCVITTFLLFCVAVNIQNGEEVAVKLVSIVDLISLKTLNPIFIYQANLLSIRHEVQFWSYLRPL
jgi:hypothetical protein